MGVIWFIFHALQLLPIRFTQQNSCCISKSIMKHMQNRIKIWTSPYLGMVIGSSCLLICWLNTCMCPIMFTIECRVVFNIQKHSPISFKHVSVWCLLFDPHRTTCQSIVGVQLRNEPLKTHLPYIWLNR